MPMTKYVVLTILQVHVVTNSRPRLRPRDEESTRRPRENKVRAVPGPSQEQFDQERDRRKEAEAKLEYHSNHMKQLHDHFLTTQVRLKGLQEEHQRLLSMYTAKEVELAQSQQLGDEYQQQIRKDAEELQRQQLQSHDLRRERDEAIKQAGDRDIELNTIRNRSQQAQPLSNSPMTNITQVLVDANSSLQNSIHAPRGSSPGMSIDSPPPPRNQSFSPDQTQTRLRDFVGPSSSLQSSMHAPRETTFAPAPSSPSNPSNTSTRAREVPRASASRSSIHSPPPVMTPDQQCGANHHDTGSAPDDMFERLKQYLDQAMAAGIRMGQGQPTSQGPSSNATPSPGIRRTIPGSRAHQAALKSEVKTLLTPSALSQLRQNLRCLIKEVTGMSQINAFFRYVDADLDVVSAYHRGEGIGPEDERWKFTLYFGEGWRPCLWNKKVVDNMVSKAIIDHKINLFPRDQIHNRELIASVLWSSIEQAQESWALCRQRVDSSGNLETDSAISTRVAETVSGRALAKLNRSRKVHVCDSSDLRMRLPKLFGQKFEERIKALDWKLSTLPSHTSQAIRLSHLKVLLNTLEAAGQSSDEDDPRHPSLLRTTVPQYRRREIGNLMSEVEDIVLEHVRWLKPRRPRHIRDRTDQRSRNEAVPPGLPQSYYHKRYLESCLPMDLARLRVQDDSGHTSPLLQPGMIPDSDSDDDV
ncbi:hypothetical protein VNI00_015500 [Paramarasmius palmivorus]|uniref:Uncharacterized protein n=1 Tax=Paramarasmius palmivorus TaxID=297713 RepID=A0AAW0BJX8_9AGAR